VLRHSTQLKHYKDTRGSFNLQYLSNGKGTICHPEPRYVALAFSWPIWGRPYRDMALVFHMMRRLPGLEHRARDGLSIVTGGP